MNSNAPARSGNYADYLSLGTLLNLQHPRTSGADSWMFGDEHLFIVLHQCSELLLRQVLIDLDSVIVTMRSAGAFDNLRECVDNLQRCAELLKLFSSAMSALRTMRIGSFASFRRLLGKASGAQSAQFHALRSVLGLNTERTSTLYHAFRALVENSGREIDEVFTRLDRDHMLRRTADAMLALSDAAWQCQAEHVRLAAWMLGEVPGTAGTSGVEYLATRTAAPFYPLWGARSAVHAQGA